MLQKTFTPDVLNQLQKKNNGELPRYLYENNHVGMIDAEIFEAVQAERKRRSNISVDSIGNVTGKVTRYSGGDELSGKIKCGECGRNFRRITTHSGEIVWKCAGRVEKGSTCDSRTVIDELLKERFGEGMELAEMYRKVKEILIRNKHLKINV